MSLKRSPGEGVCPQVQPMPLLSENPPPSSRFSGDRSVDDFPVPVAPGPCLFHETTSRATVTEVNAEVTCSSSPS